MRTLILSLFIAGAAAAQCPNCAPAVRVTVTLPAPRPAYVAAPPVVYAPPVLYAPPVYFAAPVVLVPAAPPIRGPWYLGKRADLRRMGW